MTERSWLTPGPECLTPAQLEKLAEGPGSPRMQAHVSGCAICQAELALLREFNEATPRADEAAAVRAITAQLERKLWNRPPASWWERLGVRGWAPMAAAALAAMLVLTVWVGRTDRVNEQTDAGTVRSTGVTLVAPLGELTAAPAEFRWLPVPGAARYSVRLLEVDGTVVWTGEASSTAIPMPRGMVQAGRAFAWTVAAHDAEGKFIAESAKERILLQALKP